MIKISKTHFPATVVNSRIAESISVFYESMEEFFKKQHWQWVPFSKKGDKWTQEDYTIEVVGKHPDGAYNDILYTLRRTPGIISQPKNKSEMNVGLVHKFTIYIPREYPTNLSHVKIRAATRIWHPRISMGGSGDACITVNGEIDRVLIDIIYHILMDPKRIRPPKLYPKEDFGTNAFAMRWFESDAENIHNYMLEKWDQAHVKSTSKDKSAIRVIGSKEPESDSLKKTGTTVKIIPKENKEKEEKKKGVKVL